MPKDNLTILGERLRAARNKANLTQEQLSDRSHVSIKHIVTTHNSCQNGHIHQNTPGKPELSKVLPR